VAQYSWLQNPRSGNLEGETMGKELTDLQERWVDEYLKDLNATAAAKRAGYAESSASVSGHRNITNDKVKKVIAERRAARQKRTELSQDLVIEMLLREAREADSDGARVSALKWLGEHLGMQVQQVEHSMKEGSSININFPSDVPKPE
jgi:phage terminase small subunit